MPGNFKNLTDRFQFFLLLFGHALMDCSFVVAWLVMHSKLEEVISLFDHYETEMLIANYLKLSFEASTLAILSIYLLVDLKNLVLIVISKR